MAAILYTLLFVMGGAAIIRTQLPGKSPLMRAFLGLALGILLEMQLPALCANLFDFTLKAHYVAAVILLALAGISFALRDGREAKKFTDGDRKLLGAISRVEKAPALSYRAICMFFINNSPLCTKQKLSFKLTLYRGLSSHLRLVFQRCLTDF